MALQLLDFQSEAIDDLFNACNEVPKEIIFKSCTGSGKTIVLTHFISDYLNQYRKTVFLWLTPGKGNLEEQSKAKMDKYIHGAQTVTLQEVLNGGFNEGETVFINWERLTKKGNVALKEGERKNFYERIDDARAAGLKFMVVIDESHQNDTGKANEVLKALKPLKIIRSSATPKDSKGSTLVEVPDWKVIEQGLIKKKVLINLDFNQSITIDAKGEVDFLLSRAYKKYIELKKTYETAGEDVNPLILVQLENENELLQRNVESWFEKQGCTYENGLLGVWLSGNIENKDGIEEPNAKPIALVFKQAIATGWDCPRAQILVKLRQNTGETFTVQTIGRIRRMVNAHQYGNDLLDNSYVYTLDEKFVTDAVKAGKGDTLQAITLHLKPQFKKVQLKSERKSSFGNLRDDKAALAAIKEYYIATYDLSDGEYEGNKKRLEAQGFNFKQRIDKTTLSGSVDTLEKIDSDNLNVIDINEGVSNQDAHDLHNRVVYRLATKTGFGKGDGYTSFNAILRVLLDHNQLKKSKRNKVKSNIMDLSTLERYFFVINNEERIKLDVCNALADANGSLPLGFAMVEEVTFTFPDENMFTFDQSERNQSVMDKSVYEYYTISAQPRSVSEKQFERFCELESASMKWFYKNGDKGNEYFSILYRDNAQKEKLFYPDYVVGTGGTVDDIWIIETKGGFSATGESEDIDKYSAKKHRVLREYCKKYGLKGGFVRPDKKTQELLLCDFNNEYSDDVNSDSWTLLKDVLG